MNNRIHLLSVICTSTQTPGLHLTSFSSQWSNVGTHHEVELLVVDLPVPVNVDLVDQALDLRPLHLLAQVLHHVAQLLPVDEPVPVRIKHLEGLPVEFLNFDIDTFGKPLLQLFFTAQCQCSGKIADGQSSEYQNFGREGHGNWKWPFMSIVL